METSHLTQPVPRERFATNLGILAATLGSAVGLGNIWKFPYLTGTNGGASFILVYLLATILVGLPVMIAEIMIGRRAKADAITSLIRLNPRKNQPWWLVGAMGILAAFLILAFYTEVAAWVFAYVVKAASGLILSTDPQQTSQVFTQMVSNPAESLVWQWVVLVFIGAIILLGVTKGIEAATKRLMPLLFILLIVVCIRSLSLPGAGQGLDFLFHPDFSKVTGTVVLTALGLAFFKLSIGMGTMMTYGSYFRDDQNIPATAARVMLADLGVSLLAGIAIFPAVFAFGFKPDAGASLLFITIPAVFAQMPAGGLFAFLFFLLTAIAATGAMLSLLEVPVAFLQQRLSMSRAKATILTVALLVVLGSTAALSNSTLAGFKLFGMTMFDLFDYVTSNLLLPLGGIGLCLFAGWVWSYSDVHCALSNDGQIKNERFISLFRGVVKFVSPALILIVLLNSLKVF
ncbi:MAG: sodium-dependent transporter [Anaerolineae bacterium]|nr:sodium-dependent transporter [Anaerolineae bacterium]